MKFFKENNDKCKKFPILPTGYSGIEAYEKGFEIIQPGVCPFYFPSLLIHQLVIEALLGTFPSVSGSWTHIGDNSVVDKGTAELLSVKSGIKVTEKPVHGNVCIGELFDELSDSLLYLIEISMLAGLWLEHREGDSMIIRNKEGIGGTTFLPALIFNLFSSVVDRGMGTVNMGDRGIRNLPVFPQDIGINLLPFFLNGPICYNDGRRCSSSEARC